MLVIETKDGDRKGVRRPFAGSGIEVSSEERLAGRLLARTTSPSDELGLTAGCASGSSGENRNVTLRFPESPAAMASGRVQMSFEYYDWNNPARWNRRGSVEKTLGVDGKATACVELSKDAIRTSFDLVVWDEQTGWVGAVKGTLVR